jgi:hypothetical protein
LAQSNAPKKFLDKLENNGGTQMKKQNRELGRLYGHFLDVAEHYRRTFRNSGVATDAGEAFQDAYVEIRAFLDSLLEGEANIERPYLETISNFVERTYAELQAREPSRKLIVA